MRRFLSLLMPNLSKLTDPAFFREAHFWQVAERDLGYCGSGKKYSAAPSHSGNASWCYFCR